MCNLDPLHAQFTGGSHSYEESNACTDPRKAGRGAQAVMWVMQGGCKCTWAWLACLLLILLCGQVPTEPQTQLVPVHGPGVGDPCSRVQWLMHIHPTKCLEPHSQTAEVVLVLHFYCVLQAVASSLCAVTFHTARCEEGMLWTLTKHLQMMPSWKAHKVNISYYYLNELIDIKHLEESWTHGRSSWHPDSLPLFRWDTVSISLCVLHWLRK